MEKKMEITPALNSKVIDRASQLCHDQGVSDRKSFNKNYDIAIKETGYTPTYFKNVMRQIGMEGDC